MGFFCVLAQDLRKNQPINKKTFGSIFKNPLNASAGALIDEMGYKGFQYKNVQISEKHANFMINTEDCDFKDAILVINDIVKKVKAKKGIDLEPEVKIV